MKIAVDREVSGCPDNNELPAHGRVFFILPLSAMFTIRRMDYGQQYHFQTPMRWSGSKNMLIGLLMRRDMSPSR